MPSLPHQPPNVIGPHGPRFVVGLAPGQLVLECSVEADPAPEIEWHREGILLQVGARLGTLGHCLLSLLGPDPGQTSSQVPGACSVPALCAALLIIKLYLHPVKFIILLPHIGDEATETRLRFCPGLLMLSEPGLMTVWPGARS